MSSWRAATLKGLVYPVIVGPSEAYSLFARRELPRNYMVRATVSTPLYAGRMTFPPPATPAAWKSWKGFPRFAFIFVRSFLLRSPFSWSMATRALMVGCWLYRPYRISPSVSGRGFLPRCHSPDPLLSPFRGETWWYCHGLRRPGGPKIWAVWGRSQE